MLWDWSKVKVHLVPSIAGMYEGWPSVIKYVYFLLSLDVGPRFSFTELVIRV